jgi:hypothetical protein
MEDDGFKICPFCEEKIRKEAVKCRYCGEWLEQNGQTQPSADPAPTLPKLEELPKIATDEVQRKKPPKIKREIPPKTLYWISAALLTACGFVIFLWLNESHWNQSNPGERSYEITKMIISLIKVLICAGIFAWMVKRKGYRLLTFSIVCVIYTAIGAYYFLDARHKAQEKAAESNRLEADNINSLEKFIQGGATGDIPEFKPTGDADTDAFFQITRDFYTEYFQGWRRASTDIAALQEMNIPDCLLFTNKFYLEPQIQDRIASQQIIATFKTNALSMIANYRQKFAVLNVTKESKQGFLKGVDEMSPQFEAMFDASIKSQKADQALLEFLHDNFEDYEFKDGTILYATAANRQKYDELAKEVQDASAEVGGFQKRGLAAVEAAKAKLR